MKEDQNNWESFDNEFTEIGNSEGVRFFHAYATPEKIKSWIKSNMVSKAEMRGWVENNQDWISIKNVAGDTTVESFAFVRSETLLGKLNEN